MKFEPCFSLRARRKQSRSSCDRHLPETKCLKTSLALWEAHSEDAFSRIFALCDSIGYHRILALGRMIPRTLKLILTQDVGNTRMLGSHISSQGQTLLSKFSFSELLQLRFLHWNSMLYGSWSRKEKYILFQNIFSAVLHAQMSLDQCSLFPRIHALLICDQLLDGNVISGQFNGFTLKIACWDHHDLNIFIIFICFFVIWHIDYSTWKASSLG